MFHILGFLFFIILVVLVIGLLILSKVVSLVFGFKRRMKVRIRVREQLTLLKIISRTLVRKRQQILTPHKEMYLCVNAKRFSIKTKGNTWNSKKSNKSSSSLSEEIFHQPGTFIGQHSFHDHGLRMQGLRCIALVTSFLVFCTENEATDL